MISSAHISGSHYVRSLFKAVNALAVLLAATPREVSHDHIPARLVGHDVLLPGMVVHLVISGLAERVDDAEIGLHTPRLRKRVEHILKVLQTAAYSKSLVHHNPLFVHFGGRNVVILEVVGGGVHYAEAGGIDS